MIENTSNMKKIDIEVWNLKTCGNLELLMKLKFCILQAKINVILSSKMNRKQQ